MHSSCAVNLRWKFTAPDNACNNYRLKPLMLEILAG
jgi:hypothetical protein